MLSDRGGRIESRWVARLLRFLQRYKLKQNNIHHSWDRIKQILGTTHRVTTSMTCKDGTTLHIRQSELLNEEQKEIYNILGIKHKAGESIKIYI